MDKKIPAPEHRIAYMNYLNRENDYHHPYHEEDMKQFILMQSGDPAAVEESSRMMRVNQVTQLSESPLENVKFLFVACAALASRFAIEGGMDSESSLNGSDMYIRRLSGCRNVDDVMDLHKEMMDFYTSHMAALKKENVYSKPVIQCMDYIESHLHVPIRLHDLAELVGLHPNYLSSLFGRETGISFSGYIMKRRIDAAENMLRFSDYSSSYIAEVLAFSSQSHFIRVFKKIEGITPKEYHDLHFRDGLKLTGECDKLKQNMKYERRQEQHVGED